MPLSGRLTVTTAGTAVQFPKEQVDGAIAIRPLPTNTNNVYVGNVNNDVDSTNGLALKTTDPFLVLPFVADLSDLWLDAAVNGEGITWLKCTIKG